MRRFVGAGCGINSPAWHTLVMAAVLLVRHARAGKRQDWEGDDRLRPLNARGRAQADALGPIVARLLGTQASPVPVLTSPWLRCIQTAEPVGVTLGSEILEVGELGEGMGEQAVKLVVGMANMTAVCCTHGDVIEEVLARMRYEGLDLGHSPTCPKGSIWMLQSRHGVFRAARYVAPSAGPWR